MGFAGSHDEQTLAKSLHRAPDLDKAMREKIAAVAFTSNGGWYLMCGDEFGYDGQETKIVFERISLKPAPFEWEENKRRKDDWTSDKTHRDLSLFIIDINVSLARLPQTTRNDWVEHLILEEFRDLMIIIRNSGPGFEGETRVILINLDNNPLILGEDFKEKIATTMKNKELASHSSHEYCEFLYNKLCRLGDDLFIFIGKIEHRPVHSPRPK